MPGYRASAKDIGNIVKIMMHDDETVTEVEIVDFDKSYTNVSAGYQVQIIDSRIHPENLIPFWIPVYMVSPALNP